MKQTTLTFIIALALTCTSCKADIPPLWQDWVMGSANAISNATHFGVPPDGYEVHRNENGTFSAWHNGNVVVEWNGPRKNGFEALVETWRVFEVLHPQKEPEVPLFYTRWIIETNDAPRVAMEGFDSFPQPLQYGTNTFWVLGSGYITNDIYYSRPCDKEHLDRTEQTVTKYVSSNLVSFLVWRGQTNRHYLESISVTNIVRHWHWDKMQVWKD